MTATSSDMANSQANPKANKSFDSSAFEPLAIQQDIQGLSRPSLSYWQDAWIRLKANRRALFSLYIVIGLALFTIVGPMIWQVDPSVQDLDQISQPPGASRAVTLVPEASAWSGLDSAQGAAEQPANPLGLHFADTPTTQHVRIIWDSIPGAQGYRIYRNIFPIGPTGALGLPLIETPANQTYFQDLLDLKPRDYYYSVVVLDENGDETNQLATINGTVARVITPAEAETKGLLAPGTPVEYGSQYQLELHPLGTDYLGRDMLARLMHGARISLFIGFFAPLLYVLIGVIYGSTAGFLGGLTDQVMMRFADFIVALPFLLFMILFKVVFSIGPGESGVFPMLVAMIILLWPTTARLVRGQILQIREEAYISASRLLGAKTNYLVLRHMIPNTMGVILVTITFAVPSAIFTEAFLSFIGMGVAAPTPSWGSMCNEGIKSMLNTPHELILPALFISVTVLAFNLLGDGLRDALDARMRNQD